MVGAIGFAIASVVVVAMLLIAADKKQSAAQVAHWSKGEQPPCTVHPGVGCDFCCRWPAPLSGPLLRICDLHVQGVGGM